MPEFKDSVPAASITVASYNIHQGVGWDGRRDPTRIAQVLKNLDADIIGLQEVDCGPGIKTASYQMDYLAGLTGLYVFAGPTIQRHTGDYGNVLLARHPILDIRSIDLSVPNSEPRGAIDADVDIAGDVVRIIVTHLGLGGGERRNQVEKLLTFLTEKRARPVVLLGDINEWFPMGLPLRRLHARLGRSIGLPTFPSIFPLLALDRILVWPNHALMSICVHDTPLSRIASDHLPLKAVIAVNQCPVSVAGVSIPSPAPSR